MNRKILVIARNAFPDPEVFAARYAEHAQPITTRFVPNFKARESVFDSIAGSFSKTPADMRVQLGSLHTAEEKTRSHRRTYCAADTRGGATLQEQFPGSAPCVFGNNWGADAEGVWVEGGCRGTFVVNPYNGGGPWWWDPGNGHRPPSQGIPRRGACFFKERDYRGEYFCMNSGVSFNLSPPGFNDTISSIQRYGRVSMVVYNDANFRGENVSINRSVSDLSARRLNSNRNKNWNNRISSIQIN